MLPILHVQAFHRVRDRVRIPMYGCDCYAYGLLAAGHCDLVVEADLKPYDYMALVPIIEVGQACAVLQLPLDGGSCWSLSLLLLHIGYCKSSHGTHTLVLGMQHWQTCCFWLCKVYSRGLKACTRMHCYALWPVCRLL